MSGEDVKKAIEAQKAVSVVDQSVGGDPNQLDPDEEENAAKIVAKDGTEITGFTRHGVNRAIGDGAARAGVKPQAVLDALRNPNRIVVGIDRLGRPFKVFHGENARVVVNPQTGEIVSMNPLSAAGAL